MPQQQVTVHDSWAGASLSASVQPAQRQCSESAQGHVISPVPALGDAPSFRVSDPQTEGSALCAQGNDLSSSASLQPALSQESGDQGQVDSGQRGIVQGDSVSQGTNNVAPNLQSTPTNESSAQEPVEGKTAIPVEEALFIELFAEHSGQ